MSRSKDSSDIAVYCRGLRKVYRQLGSSASVTALEGLSFTVSAGELVCIVGKTGCGKSTCFNIIAGLEAPSSGALEVFGRVPYREFQWFKGKIGVIFQRDRLLPWRTAIENVELGLEILGTAAPIRRQTAADWLERLGLGSELQAYPGELSGGMRQRVAMARAFALQPQLLLVDEAFGNLDEITAAQLRQDFLQVARKRGTTVILITHQLEEAIQMGERILVFGKPGRVVEEFRPREEKGDLRSRIQQALDQKLPVETGADDV